jgi:hypothetical protein
MGFAGMGTSSRFLLVGLAALSALALASGSRASAADRTISAYCSPSADVCYGVFGRAGKPFLRITTAAHYFGRYTLCVQLLPAGSGAAHRRRCGSFPVFREAGSTYASSVDYLKQYPVKVRGRYRVTWKAFGSALGPSLTFRLPLQR